MGTPPVCLKFLLRRTCEQNISVAARGALLRSWCTATTSAHDGSPAREGEASATTQSLAEGPLSGDPFSDATTETYRQMSAIFEGYERSLVELSSTITRKAALVPTLPREDRRAKLSEAENDMAEAEALVRRMDLEARSLPVSVKTPLLAKLRDYKTNLMLLKGNLKKAGAAMDGDGGRDELLSRAEAGDTASGAQRDRLLTATDKLKQTGDRIKEGKKTLIEAEDLGTGILQDLHKQRETIGHARETLHGADDDIGRSRRILTSMARRAVQNKVMLVGIMGVLVFMIILIVYVKAHSHHH